MEDISVQYWDSSNRAFVDVLDGFAKLPFIDDTTRAHPATLLEPKRLGVLIHEYTHLVSLRGPISAFSAYHTAMSYAVRELCELKTTYDPQGLDFALFYPS